MIKIAEIILLACMAVSMIACIILSLQRAIYQDQVQNLQPLFGSISMLSLGIYLLKRLPLRKPGVKAKI